MRQILHLMIGFSLIGSGTFTAIPRNTCLITFVREKKTLWRCLLYFLYKTGTESRAHIDISVRHLNDFALFLVCYHHRDLDKDRLVFSFYFCLKKAEMLAKSVASLKKGN